MTCWQFWVRLRPETHGAIMPLDSNSPLITSALLNQVPAAGLQLDHALQIVSVHNAPLLGSWLAQTNDATDFTATGLPGMLLQLFAAPAAASLLQTLEQLGADGGNTARGLGTLPQRALRNVITTRHLAVSAQRVEAATDGAVLLVLRDITLAHELQLAAARTLSAFDSAMTVLRTAPDAMRLFLGSALASIGAIRATLRVPARTQDLLRDKLSRVQASVEPLERDARSIALGSVVQACGALTESLARLQGQPQISGNDVLPLALLIDNIASAVGSAWRIEEQRYTELPPARKAAGAESVVVSSRRRTRKSATWPKASERRWNEFLRQRCEELGTLARLAMTGAELVPQSLRRDVDGMLQHLLRNAVEHGIETPEQRLAADKQAIGQISVVFEDSARAGLKITVRDDGRGLDLHRIGRAAVNCGLLSQESLLEHEAGDLVGLIFKPAFTTEGLADVEGHGRGMTYLRKTVARLNGQVSVATKAGRYTQFELQFPVAAALHEADEEPLASSLDKG
jgi:signal transduction histidine kinase